MKKSFRRVMLYHLLLTVIFVQVVMPSVMTKVLDVFVHMHISAKQLVLAVPGLAGFAASFSLILNSEIGIRDIFSAIVLGGIIFLAGIWAFISAMAETDIKEAELEEA